MAADLLIRMLNPSAATNAADDHWYVNRGGMDSLAGMNVDEENAQKVSAFYRGVSIIAGTIAGLPLDVFAYTADGGHVRAKGHPLFDVLHRQPNAWQTSFEWRDTVIRHIIFRGNHYSRIQSGPRGFADQLVPLNPDRMKVEQLDTGRLKYTYRRQTGETIPFSQEEILHIHGPSKDGFTGMSLLGFARESLGEQLGNQAFASKSIANGVRPGVVLKHPGVVGEEASKHLRKQFDESYGGPLNAGKTLLVEEGVDVTTLGFTNIDAQFLEGRHFGVADIGRWTGVPLVLLQEHEKSTTWGTGIEQINLGFVIYTIRSWLTMLEQRLNSDLIIRPDLFFIEFNLDGLLRGDAKTRGDLYAQGRQWGWWSVNDIRRKENENPIGADGDIYLQASNMVPAGTPLPVTPPTPPSGSAYNNVFALEAAQRLARKEIAAIQRHAKEFADDMAAWEVWATGFYQEIAAELVERLHINPVLAAGYAAGQRDALLAEGVGVIETWAGKAEELLALMPVEAPEPGPAPKAWVIERSDGSRSVIKEQDAL